MPMDLATFTDHLIDLVTQRVRLLRGPEDDLIPTCVFVSGQEQLLLTIIDPILVSSPEYKALLMVETAALAGRYNARMMAFAASAWTAPFDPSAPDRAPADSPQRQEIAVVIAAERAPTLGPRIEPIAAEQLCQAPIVRRAQQSPQLGEWQRLRVEGELTSRGRFIEAISAAFALGTLYDQIEALGRELGLDPQEREWHLRRGLARVMGVDPERIGPQGLRAHSAPATRRYAGAKQN